MQLQSKHGFQQNQGSGMETQQESYEVHQETWGSRNGHHNNHFPGMHMTNGARIDSHHDFQRHHGMFREGHHGSPSGHPHGSSSGHHHGHFPGGHNLSFGGPPLISNGPKHSHHQGHGRGYFSEVNKYEMQNSAGREKVDEMRYERHNWGGGNGFSANPYYRNINNRFHNVEWEVKGV